MMSTDIQLPENLSGYGGQQQQQQTQQQRQRPHSANSDGSRSGSPNSPSPKPPTLNANSLAASALMLQQMYPHFQDRRLLDDHQSPANFNAAALCDQFCNVINGFRGGVPGGPFQDPRKSPGVPCSRPSVDATECRLIDYRGEKVAAFAYQGDYLLCLPQAFELFLKLLVGGLHTVYAKLKRLGISPIVCNVEQVRVLRGLGAIQTGVNRCKLLACKDFDVLYKDCTAARPGRPPGRASLVGLSGVGATSPASGGHGGHQGTTGGGHPGSIQASGGQLPGHFPQSLIGGGSHKGVPLGAGPFGQTTGTTGAATTMTTTTTSCTTGMTGGTSTTPTPDASSMLDGINPFEFVRRDSRSDDELNGCVGGGGSRNGGHLGSGHGDRGQSPLEQLQHVGGATPASGGGGGGGLNRTSSHSDHGGNHLKQESRSDEETPGGGLAAIAAEADGMNAMQAMLFKAMWSQSGGGAQTDPKGTAPFPPALVANMAAAHLPGQAPMNPAMAAAMASQMDLMLGLQHNPQLAAAAAAAYQRQLLQAASLAQQQMKGRDAHQQQQQQHHQQQQQQHAKELGSLLGMHIDQRERNRSRSADNVLSKKEFRGSRESQSPAAGHLPRTDHHQSRKSSFESSKKQLHHHNNNNNNNNNSIISSGSLNSSSVGVLGASVGLEVAANNALNLSSAGVKDHHHHHHSAGGGGNGVTGAGDRKKRSRSVSSDEASLSDGPLSELSVNNLDNNDDTSNYGDDDDIDKPTRRSPKRVSDRDEALSTSSRESAGERRHRSHTAAGNGRRSGRGLEGILGLERLAPRGEAGDSRDSNHSVPTPIALMQQHLSVDRTPPPSSPTAAHLTAAAASANAATTPNATSTSGGTPGATQRTTTQQQQQQQQQQQNHHHNHSLSGGDTQQANSGVPVTGSIEALLQNILGLLKVAEENARAQEQQMHLEKAELKVEILRERGIREALEKQLQEEQHRRLFYQKKLRREKRCRRHMQEQLDNSTSKRARVSGSASDVDEVKDDDAKDDVQEEAPQEDVAPRAGSEERVSTPTTPPSGGNGSNCGSGGSGAGASTPTSVSNGVLQGDPVATLETPASAVDGSTR